VAHRFEELQKRFAQVVRELLSRELGQQTATNKRRRRDDHEESASEGECEGELSAVADALGGESEVPDDTDLETSPSEFSQAADGYDEEQWIELCEQRDSRKRARKQQRAKKERQRNNSIE